MEYEIKVFENLELIKQTLIKNKAKKVKDERQNTYVFDDPLKSIFAEQDGILRIRETTCSLTDKVTAEMTIKKLVSSDNNLKTFDEHTIILNDISEGISFLKTLGLIQTTFIKKTRESYFYEDCFFEFDVLTENEIVKTYLEIESNNKDTLTKVLNTFNIE